MRYLNKIDNTIIFGDKPSGADEFNYIEIPDDGRPYGFVDDKAKDISDNEEYLSRKIDEAKELKLQENESKRKVEFISTTKGKLKTETPLGDLKTAIPLYEKIVIANNGLPANSVRLYGTDGTMSGNPALTVGQFTSLVVEVAYAYMAIDAKSTAFCQAIQNAKTFEELEAIKIAY